MLSRFAVLRNETIRVILSRKQIFGTLLQGIVKVLQAVVGANGLEPVRYQSDLRILKIVLHNPFRGIAFLLETEPPPFPPDLN
jgi:hypothetical protein